ncbi:MAG TPA: stalk domain-containing protein [Candidatus Sulfotelmatobacter sp.]|nr:stalk domain-containing protein [Candidatus Sulfotelmatobacter sp.]
MPFPTTAARLTAVATAAVLATGLVLPAFAQDDGGPVSVTVNGNPVQLTPPPTERAGRVFVPLRGVFENLGATVVYANGQINASDHRHTISLHVGSTDAVVDGQQQTLDVAPFIIGASTYVPLRFISQALGARVNWDNSNRVVAIAMAGPGPGPNGPPPEVVRPNPDQNANVSPVRLTDQLPRPDTTVRAERPTVQATFVDGNVDPNAVKVFFDGRDVTSTAYVSGHGITYTPASPVPSGSHEVRVVGVDRAGARFERSWHFQIGDRTVGEVAPRPIAIVGVSPAPDQSVPGAFRVRGRTAPGATVTIQVGLTPREADFLAAHGDEAGNDNVQNTVTAGPDGVFDSPVDSGAPPGSLLGIQISAIDPATGGHADPVRYVVHVH